MSRTLTLRAAVRADIDEAHAWYEAERPGLGSRFREAVGATLDRIVERPHAYRVTHRGLRCALVHVFPYRIFFQATPEAVIVYACFHTSRDLRNLRLSRR